MTIFNGADAWWGEGDEKIYVDGEEFPSHFGTGTEDYYGYAWCRPEFFEAPFHAQPNGEGNLAGGYAVNCRFRSLDAIPFDNSFRFDMELWHWRKTEVDFAPTTFWYADKGTESNVRPAPMEAKRKVTRVAKDIIKPRLVEGALEGEKFSVKELGGGVAKVQNLSRFNWSDNKQLWWRDAKVDDRLVLEFEVEQADRYRVVGGLTRANDYGIVKIGVNGNIMIESLDLYNANAVNDEVDFGICDLTEGTNQLEITILGANEAAIKRYMFGLDYLLLKD